MHKKVLIISTSPRRGGNSDSLADAFAQGASTTDAVSNMSACVQSVEQLLTTRYDAATRLQPT